MTQRTALLRSLGFAGALGGLLDRIPAFAALREFARVSFVSEIWDDDDSVTISGLLTFDLADEVELFGLTVTFGEVPSGSLTIPFGFSAPAGPMRAAILGTAVLADIATLEDVADTLGAQDLSDSNAFFGQFAADFSQIGFQAGPLPIRLRFATEFLTAGRHVTDGNGTVVGVEPIEGALELSLSLGAVTLTASGDGVDVVLTQPAALDLPPVMLAGTGLAIELDGLTVKLSDGPLPPAMATLAAEYGIGEEWRGLFAESITLWNLDRLFPGGPAGDAANASGSALHADGLAIGADGLAGTIRWTRAAAQGEVLAIEAVTLGFDQRWYPTEAEGIGRVDLSDIDGGTIAYRAAIEVDPFAESGSRWRLEIGLDAAGGGALASIDNPPPALSSALAAAAAAFGDGDAALLLGALAAGQISGILDFRQVAIESASLTGTLVPEGFSITAQLASRANIAVDVLGDPVPLALGSGNVEIAYATESGFALDWSLASGLELVLPLEVDIGGFATLERIALKRRGNGHLVIELGMEVDGTGDLAIGALPNVISLIYDPVADRFLPPEFRRDGQELTLLVPGTLYAKGMLQRGGHDFPAVGPLPWGEALTASLSVYLIGNGKAVTPADHFEKSSYLYALDLGLLTATRQDGMKALVVTGDLSFRPGLPLGTTGAALYGLGLTYGQNAEPAAQNGDYTAWFLRTAPEFSTTATKWQPNGDHWGFGASVTLGSQPDDGRAWNVAAGLFLLLPGPVIMVTGKGSLFAPPPQLPSGGQGASVEAPFAAAVVLDLLRDRFAAELTADLKIAAGGRNLLELAIPAKVEATLAAPVDMELSVGRFMPMDARVRGKALGLYDITTYIMVSTRGIPDFPRSGMRLPPFAMAYGGSGGLSAGFSSSIAELRLSVQAGFDLGVSLASPPLIVGQLAIDGSLVARIACVGINIGVHTDLLVVAPDPFELSGRARLRINLPWPIPDIRFSGSFRIGSDSEWPDDYPQATDPISEISLFARPNGTAVLQSGESLDGITLDPAGSVRGVPVDAGILAAFRAPVGNDHPVIGTTQTQGDDRADPVWEVASTGRTGEGEELRIGWRHLLTQAELRKSGGAAVNARAGWSFQAAYGNSAGSAQTAPGGQGDRRALHIMAPLDAPVERRYGTGAEVLADVIEGWRPCEPPPDRKAMAARYIIPEPQALGIDRPTPRTPLHLPPNRWGALERHSPFEAGDLRVLYEPPIPGNASLFLAHEALRPLVMARASGVRFRAEPPLDEPPRLLSLPTAVFALERDVERGFASSAGLLPPAGRLLIDFPEESEARTLYLLARTGAMLDLRGPDNGRIEASPIFNGAISGGEGEVWQLMRVILPAGLRRVFAAALMPRADGGKFFGTVGALLIGGTVFLPFEERRAAAERRRDASAQLISDLGADAAGWAAGNGAGLLEPATDYELRVTVESRRARQIGGGPLQVAGTARTFTRTVRFRTESDIAQPLAPRLPATPWAPGAVQPWAVDTTPGRDVWHYRADPIAVRFADSVIAGRFAAHDRVLQLRLDHESGASASDQAERLFAEKKELQSELQDIVSAYVESQPCTGGADPLWLSLRYEFATLLVPGGYVATLEARDGGGARGAVSVHEWRFRASRWERLAAHVQAHRIAAIAQPGTAHAAAQEALAELGGRSGVAEDALIERLMYNHLGYAPLPAAPEPTLRVAVRSDGIGWLILDGPEPLVRPGMAVTVTAGGQPVPVRGIVSNAARTRSLLLFDHGVAPGALTLDLRLDGAAGLTTFAVPAFTTFMELL